MSQILASLDDINTHLPEDKIEASDDVTDKLQIDAARFIRAMFSGIFTPTQLSGWSSPGNTPELVRGIAGRIIAAKYYAIRYAEDSDVSVYAQGIYNEAITMVTEVRTGTLVVVDGDGNPLIVSGVGLSSDDFWPNNSSAPPNFTMGKKFF